MSKKNDKNSPESTLDKTIEQKEIHGKFRPSVKRLKQITDASEKFLVNATDDRLVDFQELTE